VLKDSRAGENEGRIQYRRHSDIQRYLLRVT
jgi:hypothetical protein